MKEKEVELLPVQGVVREDCASAFLFHFRVQLFVSLLFKYPQIRLCFFAWLRNLLFY